MACLVDTCGWIEWLTDGVLVTAFEPWLSDLEQVYVPTVIHSAELHKVRLSLAFRKATEYPQSSQPKPIF